jgi:1,4-dihydroxy-2-naphthoate octaprenyltransferase
MGHLKEIKSSYFRHLIYATYFNFLALMILITGLIHSIFPFLFVFTPYKLAKKIVEETEKNFINDNE